MDIFSPAASHSETGARHQQQQRVEKILHLGPASVGIIYREQLLL